MQLENVLLTDDRSELSLFTQEARNCAAKNLMQNIYGFSPNQLVYGTNPNLPNILTDGLPALDGKTSSEVFAHHMNALHASRKAFIDSESSDRIRSALRRNFSTVNRVWCNGDTVWYKRERDSR